MHYFHGSENHVEVGSILTPKSDYQEFWQHTDFYQILESHRPNHMLAHQNSIFMCDNPQDIDNAGGSTDWLLTVEPIGIVEKHDQECCSQISIALEENVDDIAELAKKYWRGVGRDNPVWEYLTLSAKFIFAERY